MSALGLGLRLLIALVCGLAALGKIRKASFAGFVETLGEMRVPVYLGTGVGAAVIGSEIGTAILIMLAPTMMTGAACAALLFTGLTVGVLYAVRSGKQVHCACFGPSKHRLQWRHVGRNAFLAIAAVIVLGMSGGGSVVPSELPIVVAVAVPGALAVVFFDDIWSIVMEES